MRMRLLVSCCRVALSVAMPLAAHHAFGGEFDANRPVLLKGKIVKMEWVNPHAWIHVEVTKPDGTKEVWMVEGGSPNSLLRRGVTRDSLPWEPRSWSMVTRRGTIRCGRMAVM